MSLRQLRILLALHWVEGERHGAARDVVRFFGRRVRVICHDLVPRAQESLKLQRLYDGVFGAARISHRQVRPRYHSAHEKKNGPEAAIRIERLRNLLDACVFLILLTRWKYWELLSLVHLDYYIANYG